ANVFESVVTAIVIKGDIAKRQTAWTAEDGHSLPFTRRPRSRRRRLGRIELQVTRDDQIEMTVAIVIEKGTAVAPLTRAADPGPCGHVLEGALAIVAIENIRSPVRDVQVLVTVIVEIRYADAIPPAGFRQLRFPRHILEFSVPGIAVQVIGRLQFFRKTLQPGPVDEKNVLQAVVIEVQKADTRS